MPDSGASAASPTPAVACVLWRQGPGGREVYLARRADSHRFLGGFWSFPGGGIEPHDEDPSAACVREVKEEIGVLLAAPGGGFRPIARFITPEFSPVRFVATYFLVEAPPGAAPDPSVSPEIDRGQWLTPAQALERFEEGSLLLPTPVVITLTELGRGDPGLEDRIEAASLADRAARLWPLAGGIAVAPLATPTLPPAAHTNAYVIGTRELVVIDPGSPWDAERAAIAGELEQLTAAGASVRAVLLTHHHGDHAGGAADLAARLSAPVWAHRETARLLAGRVEVGRLLEDGEVIELAGDPPRRLRAVFTPGHAPGHLCFHEEVTGWMVAGDMVASVGTIVVDPSEGDMAAYLASLERMAQLAPRVLLPAHGAPIADPPALLARYVRHRLWREGRVAAALAARGRCRAGELVPAAYDDLAPALHGLAERSLVAHLVKLAADGRARAVGGEWEPAG
jgi:endoribonuclease LACTB2